MKMSRTVNGHEILRVRDMGVTASRRRVLMRLLAGHSPHARLREHARQLSSEVRHLRAQLRHVQTLADLDPLVPLRNRRSFVREADRMIAYAERYDHALSLLMLDIDGLKPINDTAGHTAGDEAIRQVAAALVESMRTSDLVARLGGDEFGAILMDMDARGARRIADRITDAIARRSVTLPDGSVTLSASCGICTFRSGLSLTDAMAAADADMYRRKRDQGGDPPPRNGSG